MRFRGREMERDSKKVAPAMTAIIAAEMIRPIINIR
jgi:hypothetical protein